MLTKAVVLVLAVGVDYGRAVLSFPNYEVHSCRRLSGSRRVAAAVLLMNGEMSLVLLFYSV